MTSPSPTPEVVAEALVDSLRVVTRRLRQVRVDDDLTQPEAIALAGLDRNAPATSAELARIENISAQSMHATTRALEERGLVSRAPDPDDGRRMLLTLTREGRARTRRNRSGRSAQVVPLLAELSEDDRATLLAAAPLLVRLAQRL